MAFRYINLASLNNHPDAQHQLGLMYLRGHGVDKYYQKALERFTAASNSMDIAKCFSRGIDFYNGDNVEKDHEIAAIYLQKVVEKDDAAKAYFGPIYFDKLEKEQHEIESIVKEIESMEPELLYGRGVQLYKESSKSAKNYGLSSRYIRVAAEKNHKQAIVQLGKMYLDGLAFDKNETEAMRWIKKSIEVMNPKECYKQGMIFYNEKHYKISLLYMEKGAEENYSYAQVHLVLVYTQGLGVEKNHGQAMKWFQQSTMQLKPNECQKKGIEFYNNINIDDNYDFALLFLLKAPGKTNFLAHVRLGIIYLHGLKVEKNYNIAMEWIKSSIKIAEDFSCFNYAMMFYNGIEAGKNYAIALGFLQKAADHNYKLAQTRLGLMYLDGHGVSENEYKAMRLVEKSLETCYLMSAIILDFISTTRINQKNILELHGIL
jgi:TPR repeat protein